MSEMICVVKKLNERAKKIKKTKKRPKVFKYTSSQCKTTHFIRKRLSTKINRKLLKDKHFVPKMILRKHPDWPEKSQGIWTRALQHPPLVLPLSVTSKSGCFPPAVLLCRSKLSYRTLGQHQRKRPMQCCSKSC